MQKNGAFQNTDCRKCGSHNTIPVEGKTASSGESRVCQDCKQTS